MKIELITKLVYGQDLIYIKDEKLREVFSALTKKKTLSISDIGKGNALITPSCGLTSLNKKRSPYLTRLRIQEVILNSILSVS